MENDPALQGSAPENRSVEAWSFAEVARRSRVPILLTAPSLPDNPIVFVNSAFLSLTGYQAVEVLGQNCRLLQGADTDPEPVAKLRAAVAEGRETTIVVLNYRKDGTCFWNELFITPIADNEGGIAYFLGSQYDVTARVEAQRAVAAARDELAARLREREVLLREINHRVRNNLQVVSALLETEASLASDEARAPLQATARRVLALAAAHDSIERAEDLSCIRLDGPLANLSAALAPQGSVLQLESVGPICDLDSAVPIVLIAGELLSVAIASSKNIRTVLRRDPKKKSVILEVRFGTTRLIELQGTARTVVEALCGQIGASLQQKPGRLAVEFPAALFR